jgi:osmoprotectant transport system substrate-binding protein
VTPESRRGSTVIRKHTRRAVKAAFAVALGVAIVLGGLATTASSAERPTVVIGTKNFTEEYVLGQLYKQALEAKGYKVSYKENIGSTEIVDAALTSGKINFYPEYTGIILTAVFHVSRPPGTARAVYADAKRRQEKRGFTLFAMTPFYDRDEMGVLAATAKKYGLRTVADLKKVPDLSICGLPEFQTRLTGLVGLKNVYGITDVKFVPLAGISAYAALDAGKCLAAGVFSTDPQLAGTKYVVLKDVRNVFGFQNVAPVVSKKLASELGPAFRRAVDSVSAKLTLLAMIAMNKAVAIDKKTPKAVADAFLRANGLK